MRRGGQDPFAVPEFLFQCINVCEIMELPKMGSVVDNWVVDAPWCRSESWLPRMRSPQHTEAFMLCA